MRRVGWRSSVDMISPHQYNRKPGNKTHDGLKLRRYKRRPTVERTIGLPQNYLRLSVSVTHPTS